MSGERAVEAPVFTPPTHLGAPGKDQTVQLTLLGRGANGVHLGCAVGSPGGGSIRETLCPPRLAVQAGGCRPSAAGAPRRGKGRAVGADRGPQTPARAGPQSEAC